MLRSFALATVAALGLLTPATFTSTAQASPGHHYYHRGCYHVYYRSGCRGPWRCAGEYGSHERADRVLRSYRVRGFECYLR
jgi:hypothetical protein